MHRNVPSDPWFEQQFQPCPEGSEYDFVSRDQRYGIELVRSTRGVADLHAGIVRLATTVVNQPQVSYGCLVFRAGRISPTRLQREWSNVETILKPEIRDRIALVGIGDRGLWVTPEDHFLRRVGEALRSVVQEGGDEHQQTTGTPTWKLFEVFKVLLCMWLERRGPIAIGEVTRIVGCDHRTAAKAFHQLEREGSLARYSGRAVELTRFPQQTWTELLALTRSMRPAIQYVDASGHTPDPDDLLRRLQRLKPERVGVGGVTSARHWCPVFDLNGTPRLDLVVHAPQGSIDLRFIKRLDPGLQRVEEEVKSAVVTIHALKRAKPLFENCANDGVQCADPVETLLDLVALGLDQQVNQVITHLRPEARFL